jgi:hypothetical protein
MILFGGNNASGFLNDVWALSLSGTPTWTPIVPAGTAPSARLVPSMIYDPVRDRLLVFGGASAQDSLYTRQYFNEVWELSLSGTPTWTNLAISGTAPTGRFAQVAIYDPVRDPV